MAQRLVRRNGVLQYEDDTSLAGAQEAAGLPAPPATPAGAAAAGASPDAAKMAGTPAQKQSVFNAAAAPAQQILQNAQRMSPTADQQAAFQAQGAATAAKATRLEQLGKIKPAVQQAGQQAVQAAAGAAAAPVQVQAQALNTLPPEQQATVQQLMNDYIQNRNQGALQELSRAYGSIPEVSNFLRPFADEIAANATAAVEQQLGTQLSFDELSAQGIDASQLAADLGVDPQTLAGMTIPAIQQLAQQKQAEEFSRTAALQRELINPNTSPARVQQIREELTRLGVGGVVGAEHAVQQLNVDLQSADAITVAGRQMTTQEMLADDGLSDIIRDAVRDDKFLEELKGMEPELASWISSRKDSLTSLVADMKQQSADFSAVQKDFETAANLPTGTASEALLKAVTGLDDVSFLTAEQVQAAKESLATSGLVAAVSNNREMLSLVNTFPEWAATLKDLPKEEIETAYNLAKEVQADAALAAVLGLDGKTPFITDENMQTEAQVVKPLLDVPNTVRNDPSYIDLVKTGAVTATDVEMLNSRPEAWATYQTAQRQIADLQDIPDDKLIGHLLGTDVSFDQLNKQIEEMLFSAKYGGNAEGAEKAKTLRDLLDQSDPKDGIIDEKDIPGIRAKMLQLAGTEGSLSNILTDNKFDFDAVRSRLQKSAIEGWQMNPNDWRHDLLDKVRDGDLSYDDLKDLDIEKLERLAKEPVWKDAIKGDLITKIKTEKYQQERVNFAAAASNAIKALAGKVQDNGVIVWDRPVRESDLSTFDEQLSVAENLPQETWVQREMRDTVIASLKKRIAEAKSTKTELDRYQKASNNLGVLSRLSGNQTYYATHLKNMSADDANSVLSIARASGALGKVFKGKAVNNWDQLKALMANDPAKGNEMISAILAYNHTQQKSFR